MAAAETNEQKSSEENKVQTLDEATAISVLRQVEFYFSNSNLPTDKFLRRAVEESQEGCILNKQITNQ